MGGYTRGQDSLHIFRLSDVADSDAQKRAGEREKRLLGPSSTFCFPPCLTANMCEESSGQVWNGVTTSTRGATTSTRDATTSTNGGSPKEMLYAHMRGWVLTTHTFEGGCN